MDAEDCGDAIVEIFTTTYGDNGDNSENGEKPAKRSKSGSFDDEDSKSEPDVDNCIKVGLYEDKSILNTEKFYDFFMKRRFCDITLVATDKTK